MPHPTTQYLLSNGPPPGETALVGGVVKHLAAMEDLWFSHKLLGVPPAEPWRSAPFGEDPDWEFHSAADDTVAELRALYERACVVSRVAAGRVESLDQQAVREFVSLRWIYLHMLAEVAQRRGQLDLLMDAVCQARPRR